MVQCKLKEDLFSVALGNLGERESVVQEEARPCSARRMLQIDEAKVDLGPLETIVLGCSDTFVISSDSYLHFGHICFN